MATVKQTLDIARKEIGYKENPPDSNMTKYGKWIGLNGYAWCCSWVMWVCNQANVHLPMKTGSCGALMNAAKQAEMWVTEKFQPGDIVIYDLSGGKRTTQHCGIVEDVGITNVTAIEGNTSERGSQDNGGMVCRKVRGLTYIIGAVRPVYEPEIKVEDIAKMTIAEFVDTMTDEQAYKLLQKAQNHAATLAEPAWSQNEGQWAKAVEKKIVNGGSPEGLIKRDEFIAVIGRVGLLG